MILQVRWAGRRGQFECCVYKRQRTNAADSTFKEGKAFRGPLKPRREERKRRMLGLWGDFRVCSGRSAAVSDRERGFRRRSSGEHSGHICILSFLCLTTVASIFSLHLKKYINYFSVNLLLCALLTRLPGALLKPFVLICLIVSQ